MMDLTPDMEYGHHVQKEVREFLRAGDILIGLMRQAEDGGCTRHEMILIRGYLTSLKAHILKVETAEKLRESQDRTAPPG